MKLLKVFQLFLPLKPILTIIQKGPTLAMASAGEVSAFSQMSNSFWTSIFHPPLKQRGRHSLSVLTPQVDLVAMVTGHHHVGNQVEADATDRILCLPFSSSDIQQLPPSLGKERDSSRELCTCGDE